MEVGDPELCQDQPAINHERSEQEGKIQRDDPVDLEFPDHLFLQCSTPGRCFALDVIHCDSLPHAPPLDCLPKSIRESGRAGGWSGSILRLDIPVADDFSPL